MSDVIIIGGGPGGSTLGSYLSMMGISNTIIDKENHPRPHVGESLVTNTTRIFQEIGFLPKMEEAGFVKKYGATWHSPEYRGKLGIKFAEFPIEGIDQPYSYHIERSQFDMLLLKHAESLGSKVIQGVPVSRVLFDEDGYAKGVQIKLDGQSVDLSAKIVVDASGRNTLLGRQLRTKKKDSLFNQYAIHAWFKNVDRGNDESADHIHIYFLPVERGWVWQIPISEEVTSIGVVTEREQFKESKLGLDAYFNKHLQSSKNLIHTMRNAKQTTKYEIEGDYSYALDSFKGNGYLIVGDAARFVDPIFSSGISVAMHSAKFASEAIMDALKAGDVSSVAFDEYEEKLRRGCNLWYEFISLYYKLLPLFTYFVQTKAYRMQIFRLLQGEVFDRDEVPVLDEMRKFIEIVEKSDNHVLKDQLSSLPIDLIDGADLDIAVG